MRTALYNFKIIVIYLYIIGVVIASIAAYFIFYNRFYTNDKIAFWLFTEFYIIVAMRFIIILGKLLLTFIFSVIKKQKYSYRDSAAANSVIGMILISMFACILTLNITGLPEKAPVVQVEGLKIIIGQTTASDLLSNGFTFIEETANAEKTANNIVNKRDGYYHHGETMELVKDGKGYGYVDLTPKYKDEEKLKDCIITYFGITSKNKMIERVKICYKNISELSTDYLKQNSLRDIFSVSPITYEEYNGDGHYF